MISCALAALLLLKQADDKPLEFKFRGASVDAILQYVSKEKGYKFAIENGLKFTGAVDAVAVVPAKEIIQYLNQVLSAQKATLEELDNKVVRIVSIETAKGKTKIIQLGADPDKLRNDDTIITQIIPLKNMTVETFDKNLVKIYPKGVDVARDPVNNLFVMSGPSSDIKHFLTVLKELDVSVYLTLKVEIVSLRNANATDTAKVLNDIFRKETSGGGPSSGAGWQQMFGFGGGGDSGDPGGGKRGRGGAPAGPTSMADYIRIIPEQRTNALIIAATEENVKMVMNLALELDRRNVGVSQLRLFRLRNGSAIQVADAITALFKSPDSAADQMRKKTQQQMMWWGQQAPGEAAAADTVRAIPDVRTNSIIVSATEGQIKTIEMLIEELDKEAAGGLIKVKMIVLKNAEAVSLAATLNEVFKKEQATSAATQGRGGSSAGGPNPFMAMFSGGRGSGGGGEQAQAPTPASEIIRIVPDARTNTILVAGTEENIKIVERMVAELDSDSLEQLRFKRYQLKNADAREVASVLQQMFPDPTQPQQQAQPVASGGRSGFISQFQRIAQQAAPATSQTGRPITVKAIADMRTNTVLVAASEAQTKVIDSVIEELDREVADILKARVYKLKNSDALDIATALKAVFTSLTQNVTTLPGGPGFTRTIDITTDVRTNSVVVKASEANLLIVDEIVRTIDALPSDSDQTLVYQLKNTSSTQVMQVVQNWLKGGQVVQNTGGLPIAGTNANTNQQPPRPGAPGSGSSQSGFLMQGPTGTGGALRLGPPEQDPAQGQPPAQAPQTSPVPQSQQVPGAVTGKLDIQSDDTTNKIIVRTSPRNLAAISKLLSELDAFRPQVLVRALIVDVTLDKSTQFGVTASYTYNDTPVTQKLSTTFTMPTSGFTYLLQASQYLATLQAFAKDGKLKVLATPSVLVLDNQQAQITIGKLVPFIQNTTTTTLGNVLNTITYQNIGILLRVTPHINPDGIVTMVIHPEVSDIAPAAESVPITAGVNAPTFTQNAADTSVAIRNGQTIVLGGLIRESDDTTFEKTPILGDIPLLGLLFSSTKKEKIRRELMIFITPHVVYGQADLEELTELEKSKLKLLDPREIQLKGKEWRALLRD